MVLDLDKEIKVETDVSEYTTERVLSMRYKDDKYETH